MRHTLGGRRLGAAERRAEPEQEESREPVPDRPEEDGIDVLQRRNPGLYAKDPADDWGPVVGIDIVPEFPLRPELVLRQRFAEADLPGHASQVVALWQMLSQRTAPA